MLVPRADPCPSCPYRKNCPSGVWHQAEYVKLVAYDADTSSQPLGVFMCHDARDGNTMCRGWLDTHDKGQLLSLRLAVIQGHVTETIFELPPSGTSVFGSGAEAAKYGMRDIPAPSVKAKKVITKISRIKRKKDADG